MQSSVWDGNQPLLPCAMRPRKPIRGLPTTELPHSPRAMALGQKRRMARERYTRVQPTAVGGRNLAAIDPYHSLSSAGQPWTIRQQSRVFGKDKMQWSKRGVHPLLQTRVKTLNHEMDTVFKHWYPEVEELPDVA